MVTLLKRELTYWGIIEKPKKIKLRHCIIELVKLIEVNLANIGFNLA